MEVRYVLIGGHYRKQLNFTLDSLHAAREALAKLAKGARNLAAKTGGDVTLDSAGFGPFQAAWDSLNDDLNTPAALGGMFTGLRESAEPDRQGCRRRAGRLQPRAARAGTHFAGGER